METAGVDICLAYYERPEEVKFSVRSCTKEVHANELAAFLAEGIGGGGGHIYKAGGSIRPEKIDDFSADEIFKERMKDYFDSFDVIYAEDTTLDPSDMLLYEKFLWTEDAQSSLTSSLLEPWFPSELLRETLT